MLLALLLPQILITGAPTLLLPVFTKCSGSCPVSVMSLKKSMPLRFRVVLLSFDPEDTPADLAGFRERLELPREWRLAQLPPLQTREFLDSLGFHFMKSERGFDHPNQTFVFSARGAWADTLNGSDYEDLDAAWTRALRADDPSPAARLLQWLARPESWVVAAFAALMLSLAAVVFLARRAAA
jgi:cytochrome oxidase Cu insertion factor (SCO1/SenC/PrrC family)